MAPALVARSTISISNDPLNACKPMSHADPNEPEARTSPAATESPGPSPEVAEAAPLPAPARWALAALRLMLGLPLALFGAFVFYVSAALGTPLFFPIAFLYVFTGACVILTRRPIPIAISMAAGFLLVLLIFMVNGIPLPTK